VAVLLALGVVIHGFKPPAAIGIDPTVRDGSADALATGDSAAQLRSAIDLVGATEDAGTLWPDLSNGTVRIDGGPGSSLFDGTQVPPLPLSVPRTIRFGVAVISYAGAQPTPIGNRPSSRSKAAARSLAESLLQVAQQDFHAAVLQGDSGSSDDVGRVKLGILEPAPEYVLFTLPVDKVGGPVETPHGFWIVKRLE
jgi:hypothetical protein